MATINLENGSVIIDSDIKDSSSIYKNCKIAHSRVGENCSIGDFANIGNSILEGFNAINKNNLISASKVGIATYTGHNATIKDSNIGKFCSLSWNISVGGKNHNYKNITTYPKYHFNRILDGYSDIIESDFNKTVVGNDVWIGAGAIILREINIGDGAVIGTGAVVTKDVPPYTIVAGVPAKEIGKRFAPELIEKLLELKWWDWNLEKIRDNRFYLESELTMDSVNYLLSLK